MYVWGGGIVDTNTIKKVCESFFVLFAFFRGHLRRYHVASMTGEAYSRPTCKRHSLQLLDTTRKRWTYAMPKLSN